jgi:hypothetical protein
MSANRASQRLVARRAVWSSKAHPADIERHARAVALIGSVVGLVIGLGVVAPGGLTCVSLAAAPDPATTKPTPAQPSPEVPGKQPHTQPAQPSKPAVPTLDDLLGTAGEQRPATTPEPAPSDATNESDVIDALKPGQRDLERRLSAQEMGDEFKQAIALMGDAADRLEKHRDAGLDTQRVQEDVLRKLDELISQMEKNSQQQRQSSSSSSQQQQQQQRDPSQSQQQQARKGAQKRKDQKGQSPGEGLSEQQAPALQEGALRPSLESATAAWGSLPARVRDMLLQGAGDRFSKTWEQATETYYRRLAEEQKQP